MDDERALLLMGLDADVLRTAAAAPFADCGELAAFLRSDRVSVKAALARLGEQRLVYHARQAVSNSGMVRRWVPTTWGMLGLSWLEGLDFEDIEVRYPLSEEWQERFLANLDVVSYIYRAVAQVAGATSGPMCWRWVMSGRLGGMVSVGERRFGVLYLGRSVEIETAASIMCHLGYLQKNEGYPNMLVLRPGPVAVDRLVSDCRDAYGGRIYVAAADALEAGEDVLWQRFGSAPMDLTEVLSDASPVSVDQVGAYGPRGVALSEERLERALPFSTFTGDDLGREDRRLLELVFDWPFMSVSFAGAVFGTSVKTTARRLNYLVRRKLVLRMEVPGLLGNRYCLSGEGLSWFAKRDGETAADLFRRRSPGRLGSYGGIGDDVQAGFEMRDIWRNRLRWDQSMGLVEAFCRDIGERQTVMFRDVVPGAQWSREVEVAGNRIVFTPEVILRVLQEGRYRDFFLEPVCEESAGEALQRRIGLFLAYARSVDASVDFMGRLPLLLLVFNGERAMRDMRNILRRRFRFPLPVFVAGLEQVGKETLFGRVWRNAAVRGGAALTFNEVVEREVSAPGYRDYGSVQVFDDVDGDGREFRRGRGLQSWLRDAGESRIRQH